MEKKFSELKDGEKFYFIRNDKSLLHRKNRVWLSHNGWSNATVIDPELDGELFVFFDDDMLVEVSGYKYGD